MLARLLRLPLLVGYVLAGIVVGPHTGGPTVGQIDEIELLAEIGVALLLFSLGLEISFANLRPVRKIALIGGTIQILVTAAAATLAAIIGLGMGPVEATWFGSMISVSSTMVVLKVLTAGGLTNTLASRVMIGMLVMQDLAVIPMLVILPRLGGDPADLLSRLGASLVISGGFLAATYFLGTRFLLFCSGASLPGDPESCSWWPSLLPEWESARPPTPLECRSPWARSWPGSS
jgi:CPA2 family monovalent cation:H+ antiporter-2